jgi:succinate dehydrogenase/fumarate reductase-like Fe-S protein
MSDEGVQTTLEFFHETPQAYFCQRCGQCHKVGECPKEVEQDGQRSGEEGS